MTTQYPKGVVAYESTIAVRYDYMITGENNVKLAYKEQGKDWVIVDAAAALERCLKIIEQQSKTAK